MRTFDRGVIFIDEMALDQLDRQTRLAHATAPDDDQLVFPEKLHGRSVTRQQANTPHMPDGIICSIIMKPFPESNPLLKPL